MADYKYPNATPVDEPTSKVKPTPKTKPAPTPKPTFDKSIYPDSVPVDEPVKKMAKGGSVDKSQDKAMIKKAFKQHDAQEHKGGKGTSLKLAKGGKMRKYAEGGLTADEQEAADKAAGLEASNKEPSAGIFARLKAGNIDQPGSEAYEKYGAGRGKALRTAKAPVEPSVSSKLEQGAKEVSLPTMGEDERPAPTGMGYATKFVEPKPAAASTVKPAAVVAAKSTAKPIAVPAKPAVKPAAAPPATNDELEDYAKNKKAQPDLNTVSPEEKARRKKMESDQALQKVYPEEMLVGQAGVGLKGIAALAKRLASRKAKTEPTRAAIKELGRPSPSTAPYLQELGYTPKQLGNSQPRIGMKKGGIAKGGSENHSSSASNRGDGIAQRGKTRGKMV